MHSEARYQTVTLSCETHGSYEVREIVGHEHLTNRSCRQCQREAAELETQKQADEIAAQVEAKAAAMKQAEERDPLAATPFDTAMKVVGRRWAECESHGRYVSMHSMMGGLDRWTGCSDCARERQEREALERRIADQKAAAIRHANMLLDQARIPARFADATFESYRVTGEAQRKAFESIRKYAETFPEKRRAGAGLILCGWTGTGKTHLVTALGREVITRHGMSFLFATVSKVLIAIKSTYADREKKESDIYDALAGVDLLALDEVGVQKGSEFERNVLFEIVNRRYEECLPTILISNLAKDDIEAAVGERVMDRMRQGGRMLVFDWESERRVA